LALSNFQLATPPSHPWRFQCIALLQMNLEQQPQGRRAPKPGLLGQNAGDWTWR